MSDTEKDPRQEAREDGTYPTPKACRRHLPLWIILVSSFGGILLLLVVGLAIGTHRQWSRMQERLQARLKEKETRSLERPPLYGEPVDGSAWDSYQRALDGIPKDLKPDDFDSKLDRFVEGDLSLREEVRSLVAPLAGIPLLLRQGARCREGIRRRNWEKGMAMEIPGLLGSQRVNAIALALAVEHKIENRPQEAIQAVVDALQFSRDLANDGSLIEAMISVALQGAAQDLLVRWLKEDSLPANCLSTLSQALQRTDEQHPTFLTLMRSESLMFDATCIDPSRAGADMPSIPFVSSYLFASAANRFHEFAEAFAPIEKLPWIEQQRASRDLEERVLSHWNPILGIMVPGLIGADRALYERLAQLRLLRAAVALRLSWSFPAAPACLPDDPFGMDSIRHSFSADGSSCKIWSFGTDGIDDGGTGSWKPNKAGDIVLELHRAP